MVATLMRPLGLITGAVFVAAGIAAADATREFKEKIEPLLQDYCYDCHGDGAKKGEAVATSATPGVEGGRGRGTARAAKAAALRCAMKD